MRAGRFWQDPEAGPWASVIVRDADFAEAYAAQDLDRYLGLVAASARSLFDRDTPPGAEPEELMGMRVPALIVAGTIPRMPPRALTTCASSCRSRSCGR